MSTIDLTGKKLNRLTVQHRTKVHTMPSGHKVQYWMALCDCGVMKEVRQHGKRLKAISCGCQKAEVNSKRMTKINTNRRLYPSTKRCNTLNRVHNKKQYILDNIVVNNDTGCWEWTSTLWENGYARTAVKGCKGRAHRLSYQVFTAPFDEDLVICHTCDNPKCVNPEHLFPGTMQDNMDDMVAKGRSLKGEQHPNVKLTIEDVIKIRGRSDESRVKLGKEFGVSDCTIRDIIKRRSWTHA